MRILCICLNPAIDITSEADVIYPISKVRTRSERYSPGGGGVNVAMVLNSFGQPCELVYFSGGGTGRMLDEQLEHAGMQTRCFRNDSPTRVALTVHQVSNQQEYRFVPEGPEISNEAYSSMMEYLVTTPLSEGDIIVASGSLPRGVPTDVYARIARIAAEKEVRMVLDSSGDGLSRALDGRYGIFLVKPSLNELQILSGRKLDEQGAREFAESLVIEGKARNVAVSMGQHGAFLVSEHSVLRLPTFLVKVQSAVGAGDCFVGAMVHYLALGHSVETAFRFGVAAGAAAVMTPGDQLCNPEDVESLYRHEQASTEI